MNWETERRKEMQRLLEKGILPVQNDLARYEREEVAANRSSGQFCPEMTEKYLMGEVAAAITDIVPAKQIIDEMIQEAMQQLHVGQKMLVGSKSRL